MVLVFIIRTLSKISFSGVDTCQHRNAVGEQSLHTNNPTSSCTCSSPIISFSRDITSFRAGLCGTCQGPRVVIHSTLSSSVQLNGALHHSRVVKSCDWCRDQLYYINQHWSVFFDRVSWFISLDSPSAEAKTSICSWSYSLIPWYFTKWKLMSCLGYKHVSGGTGGCVHRVIQRPGFLPSIHYTIP